MNKKLAINELTFKVTSCNVLNGEFCKNKEGGKCCCMDALSLEALKEVETRETLKDETLELICTAINDCDNMTGMERTSETLRAALADLEKINMKAEPDKSYFFLKDLSEGCVDAIITAKTSTAEKIAEAINVAKANNSTYEWDDIVDALPDDCEIVSKWDGIEDIWY